jgi:two-component system sensor histidine kinase/response regulator
MTTSRKDKKRILIVDDNKENIRVIGSILREKGYNTGFAFDGKQALDILTGGDVLFDLILLDVNMPGMNGFDVCREIRRIEQFNELPIIFLTANTESLQIVEGFNSGGQDYVTKPFNTDELLARIDTHIELREKRTALQRINELLEEKVKERTKELEESNRKLEMAYQELQQLDESKGVFLQLISHEINTPLNGVIGFADYLKEQLASSEYFTLIDMLSESAHRLNDFAQSSLIITRMRALPDEYKKEAIDLNRLVKDVLESNSDRTNKKGIHVSLQWNTNDSLIYGNAELIFICLNHIFKNALQQTPDNEHIDIICHNENNKLILSFVDSGPGFSEKILDTLFQPFVTGDSHVDNNRGLGLAIVKIIMDFHHSEIQITNKPERGAHVEMRFSKKENPAL